MECRAWTPFHLIYVDVALTICALERRELAPIVLQVQCKSGSFALPGSPGRRQSRSTSYRLIESNKLCESICASRYHRCMHAEQQTDWRECTLVRYIQVYCRYPAFGPAQRGMGAGHERHSRVDNRSIRRPLNLSHAGPSIPHKLLLSFAMLRAYADGCNTAVSGGPLGCWRLQISARRQYPRAGRYLLADSDACRCAGGRCVVKLQRIVLCAGAVAPRPPADVEVYC